MSDYEIWNLQNSFEVAHSRLFHLRPVCIGTANVESFTSYIIRLAQRHSVTVGDLVTSEIIPLLGKDYLYHARGFIHNSIGANWWKGLSTTLNSLNQLTENWVNVLKRLTLRTDLQYLSMLPYKDLLPTHNLIRRTAAWCASCFEEWRQTSQTIYMPLIWAVEVVSLCIKHQCRLQTVCPFDNCNKTIFSIRQDAHLGYCPYCKKWLGQYQSRENFSTQEWESQVYIVDAVGEMLVKAPAVGHLASSHNVGDTINTYVEDYLDGNSTTLAKLINMHPSTVYALRNGLQQPTLGTLLKICAIIGDTPINLLLGNLARNTNSPKTQIMPPSSRKIPKSPQQFDIELIRAKLQEKAIETPPKPMSEIANELGYDHAFLCNRIPDLCQQISEQFSAYQKLQRANDIIRDCTLVRQQVFDLHSQGTYPSRQAIGGILRNEEVRNAYLDAMKDLGYR